MSDGMELKMKIKKRKSALSSKMNSAGWLFVLPFIIGFILFYLRPIIQTVEYSFGNVELDVGEYKVSFIGWDNFYYAFRSDQYYTSNLIETVTSLLYRVPVIVISSLFFAVLLNRDFKGRTFMRAVFFLSVIVASGVVINVLKSDVVSGTMLSGEMSSLQGGGSMVGSSGLQELLTNAGLNTNLVEMFVSISNNLFDLMWQTGIQMIIFLAGLQTIPPALYEAADTEGASGWEKFWMITLPMLSPMLLINIVYTVIDSFTSLDNAVIKQINAQIQGLQFGVSSAMSIPFVLIIFLLLAVIMAVFARAGKRAGN